MEHLSRRYLRQVTSMQWPSQEEPGKVRCSCGCTSRKGSVYLLAGSPFPPPFQKDHTRVNSREIRPPAHPRRITRESTRGRSANPPISERLTCGRSANPPVSERSSASKLAGDLQEGEGTNCPRVSIHHPFVTYSHNHSALYESGHQARYGVPRPY